jgi:fructuronate reductase
MQDRLSLATLGRLPRATQPILDPRAISVGIVHLGLGAFCRAHQAVYTEEAAELTGEMRWGICGASQRSPLAATTLAEQDGLYSVLVPGPGPLKVMASLRQALFAQGDPGALTARIANPSVEIVTLTVTEKGYRHNLATRQLAPDDPELAADAAGRPPKTVIGQLARGFEARRRSQAKPLTVISCDNIPSNGHLLEDLVQQFLAWPDGAFDHGLAEWVAECVRFPSTMVDRIVPATTERWLDQVAERLGLRDEAAVVTEPFSQWVIEDRFAAGRPAWERAGAQLVAEVAPYEALKLRALNGAHSALAHLGLLAGCQYVDEAMSLPGFESFVRYLLDNEVRPTLDLPREVDFTAYEETVLARFANPALPYRCLQVTGDGSQKLPQRILGVVRDRLNAGVVPRAAILVVAAWLRAVWTGQDDHGQSFELVDPLAGPLREAIAGTDEPAQVVQRALQLRQVFGLDLAEDERFSAALTEALVDLSKPGARRVVAVTGAFSR